ncbi:MAG: PucR family transcriptional regulator [Acidimicrobiales bacterium]
MAKCTPDDPVWQPLGHAARGIRDNGAKHAESVAAVLRRRIPSYAAVTVADLAPGVAASITSGMDALAERRGPSEADLERVRWVAQARAHQGIPLTAVIEAYHIGAHEIWEVVERHAAEGGAASANLLEAARLLWRWTDTVTVHAAGAHQQAGMELVRHDQQRRTEFLRALLFGSVGPGELQGQAAAHRLASDRLHLPFQAEMGPGANPMEVERLIVASGSAPDQPALVGLIEGCLAGVVAHPPDLEGAPATLVVGPPVDLAGVPASFLLACRALRAAVAFGLPGVHRVEDLALHMAVDSEDFVGDCLVARYLDPLRALRGSPADLEQTLHELFRAGLRVEDAARASFVHPNTVRHRLHRFEEVTGADLRRTEDLVGVWWALQRRRLAAGSDGRPSAVEGG